ncbi:MAG: restriction endonuclease subunit S [Saprospirales bacterium]|nr:restriction endonuclease subunit S [Saprospirales bacterium]
MSWEALTLGELCGKYNGKIQTGPFGSQLHQSDYRETGTPVVMPKDIINDRISTDAIARIDDKDVGRLSKHILKLGDIVFPRRGEINKRAVVTEESEGYICGTGCLKISINSDCVSNQFLNYYLALNESIDWLENNAVGSTMKNLSGQILSNLPISLPPFKIQRRIASILSAYDDLIENNLKRIKLLEEAAQHIYREWFVRFRFRGMSG